MNNKRLVRRNLPKKKRNLTEVRDPGENSLYLTKLPKITKKTKKLVIRKESEMDDLEFYRNYFMKPRRYLDIYKGFIVRLSEKSPKKPRFHRMNRSFDVRIPSSQKTPKPEINVLEPSSPPPENQTNKEATLRESLKMEKFPRSVSISPTAENFSASSRPSSMLRHLSAIKPPALDKNDPELKDKFASICKNNCSKYPKLEVENYREYLVSRYPEFLVETMMKHLDLKNTTFEDFCNEIDKLINSTKDKQLCVVFDIFDTNKDKYICFEDIFNLITARKSNIYDSDLIKIKDTMELKKKGMIPTIKQPNKNKQRSPVPSVSAEIQQKEEQAKKLPHYNPNKPEAITIDDFKKVPFGHKPQFLRDWLLYLCNYDINKPRSRFNFEESQAD